MFWKNYFQIYFYRDFLISYKSEKEVFSDNLLQVFSDLAGSAGLLIGFSLIGFWSFLQKNCIKISKKCLIDRKKNRIETKNFVTPDDLVKQLGNEIRDELSNQINETIQKKFNELNSQLTSRMNALELAMQQHS